MKKILAVCLTIIIMLFSGIALKAYDLVDLGKEDGSGYITYRGTSIRVQIPDIYEEKATDFRGVWISTMTGDVARYNSIDQYKTEINSVFAVMENYNLNAMVFHIRIYNDALYDSALNKSSPYYSSVNYQNWDPLAWIIEECHKRGIEFHAWMNPYRVLSGGAPADLADYAKTEPSYNIASNPEYLLKAGGGIILNPGEPVVRDFIVNTCLEVVEKYDVDAIHFDDYFYADKVDDTATRAKYNTDGLSVEDFRRLQVDLFIEQLSTAMRQFNSENDRVVQLGISPTGIYRNSGYSAEAEYDIDGNLISPIGSNTAGWEHYGHYLYCDTKKWVDNEWIDYILPQSYWAFEHNVAGYADVMDWWDRVVRNKKVNLYSGMGIYRVLSNNTYWYHKTEEALNEIKYGTKLEDVRGHCIYSYKHLKAAFQGGEYNYYFTENFRKVKTEAWTHKAIMPEIRTYNSVKLPAVQNLSLSQGDNANILTFDNNPNAKFYVIYRSIKPITYAPEEIYDIIGVDKSALTAAYSDKDNGLYFYAVRALSKTNTLSEGTATDDDFYCVTFKNEDGTIITVKGVTPGGSVTPPVVAKEGYDLIGWSEDLSEVNSDIEVYPIFQIKQYTVTFIVDDETYDVKTVNHGASLTPPEIPEKAGYNQTAPVWSVAAFSEIKEDLIVYAQYSINVYTVTFIVDDETYIVKTVNHGASLTPPEIPEKMGYERVAPVWSIAAFSEIKEDLTVYAQYTINIYTVKFIGFKDEILKTENVEHGQDATAPDAPIVSGYTFESWDTAYTNVADDLTVSAIYKQKAASFSCSKINIFGGFSTLAAILYLIFRRRY